MDDRPIGVFDSGIGGLSVLAQIIKVVPNEKYIYYADTDNVPYGIKTNEEIKEYVKEAMDFFISKNVKAVVIACNTATSIAIEETRQSYNIPVIGIEPAAKPAVENRKDKKVLLALSGGVDSSVVAALLIKAIGKNLVCVHVNHGLLRKGESEQVIEVFQKQMNANLIYVDAVDRFLDKLAGVSDPESKRKIIGAEFIDVFNEEASKLDNIEFLAQGTIYPDILESDGVKAHHNVGGLPENLKFELVEPVKLLFKDEVRVIGKTLGLPDNMVYRQPFPGPGLGVRCLGAITRDRLEAVRESDAILREEFAKNGLEGKVWQYFTIIPDFKSTGITEGKRTYEWPVIIRAINTLDAMNASVAKIDFELLQHITNRITNEVKGVNRVVFDLTPKPSGTIEWE